MKVNIIPFDINQLDYNIYRFKAINNTNGHLIMNQDTADLIASHLNMPSCSSNMYKGDKIIIDNNVKFGIVDIR